LGLDETSTLLTIQAKLKHVRRIFFYFSGAIDCGEIPASVWLEEEEKRYHIHRFMHRSYQYVTTRLWNNVPDYVRRAPSLNIFKSMLDEVNLTTRVECDCNFCT